MCSGGTCACGTGHVAAGVFGCGGQFSEEVFVVAQGLQDPYPGDKAKVAVLDALYEHGDPAAFEGIDDVCDDPGAGRVQGLQL